MSASPYQGSPAQRRFPRAWRRYCGHGHRWSQTYFPVQVPGLAFQVCERLSCHEVKWL